MPKGYKGREKTERLHMLISPEELEAIDDWQHATKVATRSDAIRRLVQIGLRTIRALPSIAKDVAEVLDMASEATDIPEEVLIGFEVEGAPQVEFDKQIANKLYDAVNFTYNRQSEAQENLYHLLVEISPLINNPGLAEAINAANKHASDDFPNEDVLLAIGPSRKTQLEAWKRRRAKMRTRRDDEIEAQAKIAGIEK